MKFRLILFGALLFGMGFQQCKPKEEKKADEEETTEIVRDTWTKKQANEWYAKQPWLVGCDFIPSTAINQLEMWQAATFDTATIDRELGWRHP